MPPSLSNKRFATAALTIVIMLAIAFFGQLTRQMTRSAFTGSSQRPTAGLSQGDYQTVAGLQGVHAFGIRNVQFIIRQPARFVLLQDRDVLERIAHPPDNQLHIAFVTDVDASRIMNGEAPVFDRYVTIQSNRKLDATAVTSSMFHQVKAGIKRQGLGDAIARNTRTINEFIAKTGHRIDETRIIGFTETDDSCVLPAAVKNL